jgi:hypothetical protein
VLTVTRGGQALDVRRVTRTCRWEFGAARSMLREAAQMPDLKSRTLLRRVGRALGWTAVATFGAALVIGGVTLGLVFHRVNPPSVFLSAPAAAEQLREQLQEAQAAQTHGTPRVLRLDEAGLNSFLESVLAASDSASTDTADGHVRDLRIKLLADRLHAYIVFGFHGQDLSFDVEGRLHTQNGYMEFDPVGARIGALPIPRSTLEAVMHRIVNSPEHRQALRLPGNLTDLHVEDGKLVVVYK